MHPPRLNCIGALGTGARANTGHRTGLRGRHLVRKKLFVPLSPLSNPFISPLLVRAQRGHFCHRPPLVGVACPLGSWRWWPLGHALPLHSFISGGGFTRMGEVGWGRRVCFIRGLGIGFSSWGYHVTSLVLGTLGVRTLLSLPSGALRLVDSGSWAWVGGLGSGPEQGQRGRGARVMRARGHRPGVRGTVKNPNDHPHGGRTRAIAHPRTPWGR
jgi:hypothetical protein